MLDALKNHKQLALLNVGESGACSKREHRAQIFQIFKKVGVKLYQIIFP